MNRADVVARLLGCNPRLNILVAWIGPPPPPGTCVPVVLLVVAGVAGNVDGVQRWSGSELHEIRPCGRARAGMVAQDGRDDRWKTNGDFV